MMPVFSRTVVTAEEILRTLPPDEDSLYTTRGVLRKATDPSKRCQAGSGKEYHCTSSAEADGLCVPHWERRKNPPKRSPWDGPLRPYGRLRS